MARRVGGSVDAERWSRLRDIFAEVLELPEPERLDALERRCGGDGSLRTEIEGLLVAYADSAVLEAGPMAPVLGVPVDLVPPPYRLITRLGAGGVGEVFLAERTEPYVQQVAIKVLRRGMDTAELVRRFEAERQILATLDHPAIASVLDGGTTHDGRPFLVMEHVDGARALDRHAAELPVRERLALLITVCEAVQHAHEHLVVHRDLKPSNVLVSGQGQVKLLDFGIAKLLDPTVLPGAAPPTRTRVPMLTPAYAAPEQLRGEAIATVTDVYALGIILYELVAGGLPFPPGTEEPDPPAPLGEGADLDTIVARALQPEPARRYRSAAALGDDLQRWLDGRPIAARRDSMAYRTRLWARRRPVLATLIVALLVGTVLVTGLGSLQARRLAVERDRAALERDLASEVVDLLLGVFEASNPARHPEGRDLTVGELLESTRDDVLAGTADRPELGVRIRVTLAEVYQRRGEPAAAEPLLNQALATQRGLTGPQSIEALELALKLGRVEAEQGELEHAETRVRAALDGCRQRLGPDDPMIAEALVVLATTLPKDSEERVVVARRGVEIWRRQPSPDPVVLADALNGLAVALMDDDDLEGAVAPMLEAHGMLVEHRGREHPHTLDAASNLVALYGRLGEPEQALAMSRERLASEVAIYGDDAHRVARSWSNIGVSLAMLGRMAEAEDAFRQSQRRFVTSRGARSVEVANATRNVARALQLQGHQAEARPVLEAAVVLYDELDPGSRQAAGMSCQLGSLDLELGAVAAADRTTAAALERMQALDPDGHAFLAACQLMRASVDLALDEPEAAVALATDGLAYLERTRDPTHPQVLEARCVLGLAQVQAGDVDAGRALIDAALPGYQEWGLASPVIVADAARTLGQGE